MSEKRKVRQRILLSKSQVTDVSDELYRELAKMPLYDYDGRKAVISRYIEELQKRIKDNLRDYIRNAPEADSKDILADLFQDIFEDSLDRSSWS